MTEAALSRRHEFKRGVVRWDLIESSLRRLHDRVSCFIDPSAALRGVRCLKAQIELRGQVLRDIEVMRCGLRPLKRCQNERCYRRRCRVRRSGLVRTCPPVNLSLAIGFFWSTRLQRSKRTWPAHFNRELHSRMLRLYRVRVIVYLRLFGTCRCPPDYGRGSAAAGCRHLRRPRPLPAAAHLAACRT
jgi:hypothetical protein